MEQAVGKGAAIDYMVSYGVMSPLMTALYNNHPSVALYLLAQGADVDLTEKVILDWQPGWLH